MSDDTSAAETDGDRSGGGGERNTGDFETSGDVDEEHPNSSEGKNITRSPNQSSINRLLRESSKYDLGRSLN